MSENEVEKPQEPELPSLGSVLAMPVSLVLMVGALGLGLLIGIDTGGGEAVPTEPTATEPVPNADGEQLFASQGCGGCHTLTAAGATGTVGPNLDETQLTAEEIANVVTNGRPGTAMSGFKNTLSTEQIESVAAYVKASAP